MNKALIRNLLLSSAFSIALVAMRIEWSGSIRYIFLGWNLFLAWVPFLFALLLDQNIRQDRSRTARYLLFGGWLLFFPNAPYLLTDLFHLDARPGIPLWFDLLILLSYAWNGLLLAFVSLMIVERSLLARLGRKLTFVVVSCLLCLCSFGIYLGRYPRYNSWDIFTRPLDLLADIGHMLLHPLDNTRMVGMTFFFSIFLIGGYSSLLALIRSVKAEERNEK